MSAANARTVAAAFAATVAMIAANALAAGCQAIVSSTVPDFRCSGIDPAACPDGMVCDGATQRCVSASSVAPDSSADLDAPATADADATTAADTGKDTGFDAGPLPIGVGCRVNAECASGLCGDGTLLTTATVSTSGALCTKACCRSEDCPTGTLCYGPGTGGRYCVPYKNVSDRAVTVGAGLAGGAACTGNSQCRSGLCTGSKCLDVCCTSTQCTNGTICRLTTVSGHDIFACGPAVGGAAVGSGCAGDASCTTNVCYPSICRAPCCGVKTCTDPPLSLPSGHCAIRVSFNKDSVGICLITSSGFANGAACVDDTECRTEYCDPDTNTCADVCCVEGDCAALGTGYHCVPSTKVGGNSQRQLHCAKI